jgi:hypothetical protein
MSVMHNSLSWGSTACKAYKVEPESCTELSPRKRSHKFTNLSPRTLNLGGATLCTSHYASLIQGMKT